MTKHLDGQAMDSMMQLLGMQTREGRAAISPEVVKEQDDKKKDRQTTGKAEKTAEGERTSKEKLLVSWAVEVEESWITPAQDLGR